VPRGGAVFAFYYQKVFLAAIDGNQVRHELSRHGQRGAIGIVLLLFPVIDHRQVHTVSLRHLCCLNQYRLQMPPWLYLNQRVAEFSFFTPSAPP
jgi:hypothetical protein